MHSTRAAHVYWVYDGALSFISALRFTVLAVYYIQAVGMTPLQLVLVGTVLEGAVLLFEIPTGVVADTYGRRISVIVGTFIIGAAFILEGSLPLAAVVLLAEAIRGLGETFLSGATDAWLADEVGEENLAPVYLRAGQIGRVCSLAGIGASVALASLSLSLPIIISGGVNLLVGIYLLVRMPENGFKPAPRGPAAQPWRELTATLHSGVSLVRARPLLLMLLGVNLVGGAASEGFDRLWEAHILTTLGLPALGVLQPVVWFGILNAGAMVFTLATSQLLLGRFERASRSQPALILILGVSNLLAAGLTLGFALAGSFWAGVGFWLLRGAVMAVYYPLYSTWLAQNIDSQVRATVISITSQTNALGQVAGGPLVGAVGTHISLRAALSLAALLLAPASAVYAAARRKPEPAPLAEAAE